MSNTQDLQTLARECGATAYTDRHYPDGTALAFGPEAFAKFCAALKPAAAQPKVVDPETSRAIDEAVKAGRIVFEPGWNAQPPGDAREPTEADFVKWRDDYGLRSEPNWSGHTEMDCAAAFAAGAAWQAATAQASEPSAEHVPATPASKADMEIYRGIADNYRRSKPIAKAAQQKWEADLRAVVNAIAIHARAYGYGSDGGAMQTEAREKEDAAWTRFDELLNAAPARAVEPLTISATDLAEQWGEVTTKRRLDNGEPYAAVTFSVERLQNGLNFMLQNLSGTTTPAAKEQS